jgi:hypothetical protein
MRAAVAETARSVPPGHRWRRRALPALYRSRPRPRRRVLMRPSSIRRLANPRQPGVELTLDVRGAINSDLRRS